MTLKPVNEPFKNPLIGTFQGPHKAPRAQLIQSTWTQERLVEKLRSVGGADEEDVPRLGLCNRV